MAAAQWQKHTTHNPKIIGSNPAAGTGKDKMAKKFFKWFLK